MLPYFQGRHPFIFRKVYTLSQTYFFCLHPWKNIGEKTTHFEILNETHPLSARNLKRMLRFHQRAPKNSFWKYEVWMKTIVLIFLFGDWIKAWNQRRGSITWWGSLHFWGESNLATTNTIHAYNSELYQTVTVATAVIHNCSRIEASNSSCYLNHNYGKSRELMLQIFVDIYTIVLVFKPKRACNISILWNWFSRL